MKPINDFTLFRCPKCRSGLIKRESSLFCCICDAIFPIRDSVQVFMNLNENDNFHAFQGRGHDSRFFKSFINIKNSIRDYLFGSPNISLKNVDLIIEILDLSGAISPPSAKKILIIGAGDGGAAVSKIINLPKHDIYGLDVAPGQSVNVLADAHDLPFFDKSFDLVIIQAVLEHVIKPINVVNEIRRVLRNDGVVYAETPFMQPVHEGIYDYQRYTLTGHRYLFKDFTRLKSGSIGGSALALSWLFKTLSHKALGKFSFLIWLPASFILKFIDLTLYRNGDNVGMCGVFFLGRSSMISPDELSSDLKDSFFSM